MPDGARGTSVDPCGIVGKDGEDMREGRKRGDPWKQSWDMRPVLGQLFAVGAGP